MTSHDRERRTTRRMLAGALGALAVLIGAAVMLSRASSARPGEAISAPKAVVLSTTAPMPNAWATLTPVEQETLRPLQPQWANIDAAAKAHWIQVAERLHGRPSRAVARAAQHMAAWQQLSPAERAQARLHYKMAARLSPAERERRWETYQASLRATPQVRDESRRVLTAARPSMPIIGRDLATPAVTSVQSGVPASLRVRAAGTDTPASAAATADAS